MCARERKRETEGGAKGEGGGDMERKAKGERERRRKDGKRENVELIFPHAHVEWESIYSIEIRLIAILNNLFKYSARVRSRYILQTTRVY